MNIPNALTIVRIILIPVFVVFLMIKVPHGDLVAAIIFAYRWKAWRIPVIGQIALLAFMFILAYWVAKSFGKGELGFTIGLTLLPMVFYCILGFGDAVYLGPSDNEEFFEGF